jgi:TPR repeat protein
LLIAALAAAVWHWRQDLRVVADRLLNTLPPAEKPGSDKPQPSSPAPVAADSTSGTAPASNAPAPIEQVGAQAPAAQTPPTAAPAAPAASGTPDSTQPVQQTQPPNQSRASEATSKAATAKPDESEEAATPPARATKSDTRAVRATASASRGDDLEVQGEKYLYGNGVPENCTRARTNLLAAAEKSNAQAQSVLATMYATGHCATRDLPTAYRWFGRSLRQDPKNSRIEQDLRVLWNQMTPEERQKALRSER